MTPLLSTHPRPTFFFVSQGTEHHWFDSDAMEDQIGSLVENAVSSPQREKLRGMRLLQLCFPLKMVSS